MGEVEDPGAAKDQDNTLAEQRVHSAGAQAKQSKL
jgi:hypothetical protein